mmetsp:Transcript_13037/g.19859  ORF Transcript_13037/g.19859 Transcript_13037/m.19859 type:complete len:224 (+) Transcript_13037:1723-2394(+)
MEHGGEDVDLDVDSDESDDYSEYSRGNMSELTTEEISHACLSTKTPKSTVSNTSATELYGASSRVDFPYAKVREDDRPPVHFPRSDNKVESSSVNGRMNGHDYSDRSVQSSASYKMSVAQRARLNADNPAPSRSVNVPSKKPSMFDKLGDKLTRIVDESPLGVKVEKPVTPLSLKDRERRQRESQLQFLRKEGLIKETPNGECVSVTSGSGRGSQSSVDGAGE